MSPPSSLSGSTVASSEPVTIRLLDQTDAVILNKMAPGVFDHAVDVRWCSEFFADPRHHLAVALLNGQVIGMASAVHYVHPDKPPELWINEVGVAPEHQGRGIGRQLMQTLLDHGRWLGCSAAWVLTDEGNEAARKLYAAAGGVEKPAVLVSYNLDAG